MQAAYTNQHQKDKQPNQKAGGKHKQIFLQRHIDG